MLNQHIGNVVLIKCKKLQNLISQGLGLLVIPEREVPGFKKLLIEFYEKDNDKKISKFLKEKCWRKIG